MPPTASLEQQVDVEIPEQVAVSYTVAGLGSRAAAALVDAGICIALYGLLYLLAMAAVRARGGSMPDTDSGWVVAVLLLGQFALFWGWYVLWEGLRDGQTPGKRRFGLRVVRDGGFAVDFPTSALRNLVRVVDMQPGLFYGVGVVSVLVSRAGRRLGDHVAGTIVVRERTVALRAPAEDAAAAAPERGAAPLTTLLDDDEYTLLQRYVQRRGELAPARAAELGEQLAARLQPRAAGVIDPPPAGTMPPPYAAAAFLERLLAHETAARARGIAARSDTGARREQHALVAQGAPRWAAFARRLEDAQARGLDALGEEEVSSFVAQYRELTTDLARLQTAARGREVDAVYYLSRLVASGHNLLYRGERAVLRVPWHFLLRTIPMELRRSWRPIALAALLFFGPFAVTFEAARRSPEAAARLVPRAMVDRAETGLERAQQGGGYLPEEAAAQRGSLLASAVATNNVQITYVVFAGGATAGLLTTFVLVNNGLMLGGPFGLYARMGLFDQILNFVAAHGVIELTAICVAGGAGFQLAAAILLPGALTRRDALRVRGRRALTLIAAATLFLIVAGILEGYVSPLVFPTHWKLLISAATAVGLVWYWTLGMRVQRPGEEKRG